MSSVITGLLLTAFGASGNAPSASVAQVQIATVVKPVTATPTVNPVQVITAQTLKDSQTANPVGSVLTLQQALTPNYQLTTQQAAAIKPIANLAASNTSWTNTSTTSSSARLQLRDMG
jgi:hypothetical protein